MNAEFEPVVFTIGHSTLPYWDFLSLLRGAGVTAVADVRSSPYSRHQPQFNRETLYQEFRADGIAYVFLGDHLGGRPRDSSLFRGGVADYEEMAKTKAFRAGIKRVLEGANKYKVALMCSERNPLDCHRCLLVGRALKERKTRVMHIMDNGDVRSQEEIECDLLKRSDMNDGDMFKSLDERLALAYGARAKRVAYSLNRQKQAE